MVKDGITPARVRKGATHTPRSRTQKDSSHDSDRSSKGIDDAATNDDDGHALPHLP